MALRHRSWVLPLVLALVFICIAGAVAWADGNQPKGDSFFQTHLGPTPEPNLTPVSPVSSGVKPNPLAPLRGWLTDHGRESGLFVLAVILGLVGTFGRRPSAKHTPEGEPPEPSWWDRTKGWFGRKWEWAKDRWDDGKAWVKHVGLPWLGYVAKSAGMYLLGLFIETVGGVTTFGLHALASSGLAHLGLGTDLNEIDDYWFQLGRRGAGPALQAIGILEMGIGLLGEGGGFLLSLTGVGAPVGVPAMAVSAGVVAAGGLTFGRGVFLSKQADEAVRRTGGRTIAKRPADLELLSEKEVRKLLGPNASEKAVQQFMRFQQYAAEKLGNNLDKARVREMLEKNGSLRQTLQTWIQEVGPEEAAAIFHRYTGRRQMLGAITESRLAAKLASNKDFLILEVVPHTNQRGADIYYVNLKTMRPGMADAKGSMSGMIVRDSSAFHPDRFAKTHQQLSNALRFAREDQRISLAQFEALQANMRRPTIVIGTGGTASVQSTALEKIKQAILSKYPRMQIDVEFVPLD